MFCTRAPKTSSSLWPFARQYVFKVRENIWSHFTWVLVLCSSVCVCVYRGHAKRIPTKMGCYGFCLGLGSGSWPQQSALGNKTHRVLMKTAWSSWHCVCVCVCALKEERWLEKAWEWGGWDRTFGSALEYSQVFLFAHICSVCVLQACARVSVCVVPWPVSIESHDMAVFGVVLAWGEACTCFTLLVVYVLRVILGRLTGSNQLYSRS